MASMTLSFLFGALLVLSFVQNSLAKTGITLGATSPGKQPDSRLLKGILDEVRELRTTLQQHQSASVSLSIDFDRVRRQEERVKTAEGELRELRASMRELTDPTLKAAEHPQIARIFHKRKEGVIPCLSGGDLVVLKMPSTEAPWR